MALLESVWPAAVQRVKEEVKDMQALADKEGAKIKIEPWDYRYYAEKVRKSKFDLDQDEVKTIFTVGKTSRRNVFCCWRIVQFRIYTSQ
jgi:peptidyl-dipeptidase Dcp